MGPMNPMDSSAAGSRLDTLPKRRDPNLHNRLVRLSHVIAWFRGKQEEELAAANLESQASTASSRSADYEICQPARESFGGPPG